MKLPSVHLVAALLLALVLAPACKGSSSGAASGSASRCADHMKLRKKEGRPAGKPELEKCEAAMKALKERVSEEGFYAANSCLQASTIAVEVVEGCVRLAELGGPKAGVDKNAPAFVDATNAIWDRGIVGDSPSRIEAARAAAAAEGARIGAVCGPTCEAQHGGKDSEEYMSCYFRCVDAAKR